MQRNFPKMYRYNLGDRMVNANLDMLTQVVLANTAIDELEERLDALKTLMAQYETLIMLFRLCIAQRIITAEQYAAFLPTLNKIGQQITGWRTFTKKQIAKGKITE